MENINNLSKFENIESLNLQPNQYTEFNIYKDFEIKNYLEKNLNNNNINNDTDTNQDINSQINTMTNSLPFINDNIRANIKLSIEIYKKIKCFDREYIHKIIENKKK